MGFAVLLVVAWVHFWVCLDGGGGRKLATAAKDLVAFGVGGGQVATGGVGSACGTAGGEGGLLVGEGDRQ